MSWGIEVGLGLRSSLRGLETTLSSNFSQPETTGIIHRVSPVIIGRWFSKIHGLEGHRIGCAMPTPMPATPITRMQMSSVNRLGVAAARAALLDREFPAWSRKKIAAGRDRLAALLDELGFIYTPSHGNFIFHRTGRAMGRYQAEMNGRGILVGWPHAPVAGCEDWCRTSIGTDAEMAVRASAMRAVLTERS